MSWLSSAVRGIGKAGKKVGHALGKVAGSPIVTGAAGLFGGPLAGALVGAGGKLLAPGGNLGRAAQGAATGALAGAVRPLLGGKLGGFGGKIGGFAGGSLQDMLRTSTMGRDQAGGGFSRAEDGFGFGGGGGGGGLGGILKGAVRGLGGLVGGGGGGLGNLAVGGLAGYQALNAANAAKRAGKFQDKALGMAEQRWAEGAPLRTAGQARVLNPVRPDLSGAFTNPANPFAGQIRRLR